MASKVNAASYSEGFGSGDAQKAFVAMLEAIPRGKFRNVENDCITVETNMKACWHLLSCIAVDAANGDLVPQDVIAAIGKLVAKPTKS